GIVVGIGGLPDSESGKELLPAFARPALWLMTGKRRRAARRAGVRFLYLFMRPDGAELAELCTWVDAGRLRPIIHQTLPFARVADAFAELERGHARGKIVVELGA
ncbi:MAG TPA: zinc-binding dehydrogenase, partial [Kofleriaceae bacterium]|nr:zinc-binding dehydrogenase [Kofleriaceae bacterium]